VAENEVARKPSVIVKGALWFTVVCCLIACASAAHADEPSDAAAGPPNGPAAPTSAPASAAARPIIFDDPKAVKWRSEWHRVRLAETIDTAGLAIAATAISFGSTPPPNPRTSGGILFDNWVRKELRGTTYGEQSFAASMSDAMLYGSAAAPFAIDVWIVSLGVHQNADVMGQMFMIDLQSLTLTGTLTLIAERTVARQRPFVQDCGPDGRTRSPDGTVLLNGCGTGTDQDESFFSGHAAVTATMAGLTCIHHQHLPLYGGGPADLTPCLLMIGVSLTTGVERLVADKHWASDVITGWGVGAFSGYLLPAILHYGFGHGRPIGEVTTGSLTMLPTPKLLPGGAGMGVVGTF
jgi:membrane-associated phospholipid phosphatase